MTEGTTRRIVDEMVRQERPARIGGARDAFGVVTKLLEACLAELPAEQEPAEPFSERENAIIRAAGRVTLTSLLEAVALQRKALDEMERRGGW